MLPGHDAKLAAQAADAVPPVPHLRLGIGLHRSPPAQRMLGGLPGVLVGRLLMDSDICLDLLNAHPNLLAGFRAPDLPPSSDV
jgi:hypothetical protein